MMVNDGMGGSALVGATYRGYDGVVHTATLPGSMGGSVSARRVYEMLKFSRQQESVAKSRASGSLGEVLIAREAARARREAIERAALYAIPAAAAAAVGAAPVLTAAQRRALGVAGRANAAAEALVTRTGARTAHEAAMALYRQSQAVAAAAAQANGLASATGMPAPGANQLAGPVAGAAAGAGAGAAAGAGAGGPPAVDPALPMATMTTSEQKRLEAQTRRVEQLGDAYQAALEDYHDFAAQNVDGTMDQQVDDARKVKDKALTLMNREQKRLEDFTAALDARMRLRHAGQAASATVAAATAASSLASSAANSDNEGDGQEDGEEGEEGEEEEKGDEASDPAAVVETTEDAPEEAQDAAAAAAANGQPPTTPTNPAVIPAAGATPGAPLNLNGILAAAAGSPPPAAGLMGGNQLPAPFGSPVAPPQSAAPAPAPAPAPAASTLSVAAGSASSQMGAAAAAATSGALAPTPAQLQEAERQAAIAANLPPGTPPGKPAPAEAAANRSVLGLFMEGFSALTSPARSRAPIGKTPEEAFDAGELEVTRAEIGESMPHASTATGDEMGAYLREAIDTATRLNGAAPAYRTAIQSYVEARFGKIGEQNKVSAAHEVITESAFEKLVAKNMTTVTESAARLARDYTAEGERSVPGLRRSVRGSSAFVGTPDAINALKARLVQEYVAQKGVDKPTNHVADMRRLVNVFRHIVATNKAARDKYATRTRAGRAAAAQELAMEVG